MNALEKIAEKDKEGRELTKIEVAIYWVWNDTHTNMGIAYEAAEENAAMQARIEALETEQTRLNKIIHAVEVASHRKLKMNENVWDIISDVQSALESA